MLFSLPNLDCILNKSLNFKKLKFGPYYLATILMVSFFPVPITFFIRKPCWFR